MTSTLLQQGLFLMLTGMGTVFVFLTALVLAMKLMSRLLSKLPAPAPAGGGPDERDREVAAITAAIRMHRSRNEPK